MVDEAGTTHVSSKGFFAKGFVLADSPSSIYWRAVHATKIDGVLRSAFGGRKAQAFGEAIPVQGQAWSYGADANRPTLRIFRVVVDGCELSIPDAQAIPELAALWAPIVYQGPFDLEILRPLAKGREQVTGKQMHKREGIVVTPAVPRTAREGFNLSLKLVSPDFRDSDDAVS